MYYHNKSLLQSGCDSICQTLYSNGKRVSVIEGEVGIYSLFLVCNQKRVDMINMFMLNINGPYFTQNIRFVKIIPLLNGKAVFKFYI